MSTRLFLSISLAVATLAAYARIGGASFINYDDPDYVTANPVVSRGLTSEGIKWSFTSGVAANWHPLTWLAHMLDVELFGMNPAAHHWMNVALHAANSILVFLVFERLTGACWRSALVAGLFALHPTAVEVVAWVSQRKTLLATFFWLAALGAYAGYARRPGLLRYLAVTGFFVSSLLAKPMAVTFPFLLLVLDGWPLGRTRTADAEESPREPWTWGGLVIEKLPWFFLAAASSAVTYAVQQSARTGLTTLGLADRLANALAAYVSYLGMLAWPANLSVLYPHPMGSLSVAAVASSAVVLAVISIVAYVERKSRPYVLTGWLWYLGTLAPVIGLVQVGRQAMADRYLYGPALGVFLVAAWFVGERAATLSGAARRAIAGAASALLAALALVTFLDVGRWRDSETLFRAAIADNERNAVAHYMLGVELDRQGRPDEAIVELERALAITPQDGRAHVALATFLLNAGKPADAVVEYTRGIELEPENVDYLIRRGLVLAQLGRFTEGIKDLEKALSLEPRNPRARVELALLLVRQRRYDDAIGHFQRAIASDPEDPIPQNALGSLLAQRGRFAEARTHYEEALRLRPDFAEAAANLGLLYLQTGRTQEAIDRLQTVAAEHPEHVEARLNLAAALAKAGKAGEAEVVLEELVREHPQADPPAAALVELLLRSAEEAKLARAEAVARQWVRRAMDRADPHRALAAVLLRRGKHEEAAEEYAAVLQLAPDDQTALNNRAWFLAVAPEERVRSPDEAVRLAERLNQLTLGTSPSALDTLAAAYAAAGRFAPAIEAASRAERLARSAGDDRLAEAISARRKLYEQKKPFVETAAPSTPTP